MPQRMRLVLSGGGTGGHIVPNVALIQELRCKYGDGLELLYIGSRRGMEKEMIGDLGVDYKGVYSGKLRRYFSWENFFDLFKIPVGILQAFFILKKFKPRVVFCKGGYTSFPVAFGGWMVGVPVILHESDVVPGLSNKMSAVFATKICVSFEESKKYFDKDKVVLTGNPIRKEIAEGNANIGKEIAGFNEDMPVVFFMGGSQGATVINNLVWDNMEKMLGSYQVLHICGKGRAKNDDEILTLLGNGNESLAKRYKAFEFVGDEMKDLYALSDIIVSRAGAMTLAELAVLRKPAILIPLGTAASRGDQIDNAKAYAKEYQAHVISEDELEVNEFFGKLAEMLSTEIETKKHENSGKLSATGKIISLFEDI